MAQAGNLNDWLSSDTAMWAAPLALGFMAGATPGTARAAYGLSTGLQMVGQAQERKRQEAERDQLRQRLSGIFSATRQAPQIETEPGDVPIGDRPVPIYSPEDQRLGEALIAADRPEAAISLLSRQQRQPHTFGSPEVGYYALGPDGQPVPLVKGVGRREPTPPRPVYATQGGEGVSSVYNPQTGAWEEKRTALTPAPARQLGPEERELTTARTANVRSEQSLRTQRIQNLKQSINRANDPRATAGQLSSAYNALIRDRDSIETAEEDKPVINDAIRQIRSRLAELGKAPGATGQPAAATVPPGTPIGKTKNGKIVYEAPDGRRFVAD